MSVIPEAPLDAPNNDPPGAIVPVDEEQEMTEPGKVVRRTNEPQSEVCSFASICR